MLPQDVILADTPTTTPYTPGGPTIRDILIETLQKLDQVIETNKELTDSHYELSEKVHDMERTIAAMEAI